MPPRTSRTATTLNVVLNGRLVGRLTRQNSGAIEFQYDRTWLEWNNAMPVSRSLPLREQRYIGRPVIAVFEGLLPDNDTIRAQIAERMGAGGNDAFSLLAAVGRDCIGALQFLPEGEDIPEAGAILSERMGDDDIAYMLDHLHTVPLGMMDDDDDFRISLAGAQKKTALLFIDGQWHKPKGATPTTHILKPQIGMLKKIDMTQSVENEFLCMTICAEFGLPTANVAIHDFDGVRALSIERFDRLWTADHRLLRVPQEDFCQALSVPPSDKYQAKGGPNMQDIMNLLTGSDDPTLDRQNFMLAQIVFWLLGATDGHAKNFSISLLGPASFNMTPLYDVLSAQPAVDAHALSHNKFKLAMSVGTKNHYVIGDITPRHFLQSAERAGQDTGRTADLIESAADSIPGILDAVEQKLPADFPEALFYSVRDGMLARRGTIGAWQETIEDAINDEE